MGEAYIMPWRIMEYDCREYEKQIRKIQGANRRAEEQYIEGIYANAGALSAGRPHRASLHNLPLPWPGEMGRAKGTEGHGGFRSRTF